jgi:hypothetical protein
VPVVPSSLSQSKFVNYVIKGGETIATALSTDVEPRSLQAGGDWTGNRWYQKYGDGLGTIPISGMSTPFKLYELENSYDLVKVNDSWDYAEYFKSLCFPETLSNNNSLFTFISAAIGDGDSTTESIGRVSYEKIANFVNNKADIETAQINALQSMATQTATEFKTYGEGFPVAVNKLLDLFSVHKHYLRGLVNIDPNIDNKIVRPNLTTGDVISAYQMYYIYDIITQDSFLIYPTPENGKNSYLVSEFEPEGFRYPFSSNYKIYLYNEQKQNETIPYIGNVIDWEKCTTFNYNMSSAEDWYGPEGIVESMFVKLLTKQLFGQ